MSVFIIAEAGVNHNGDDALAFTLVETAARCGADAVKFQTFSAEKLVRPGARKAEYQEANTGAGDQFDMLKALEMTPELHRALHARCRELDIEFMSTPFDEEAADFLVELGMRRIKIPSGEITNVPFLGYLARFGVPLILSTGMADLEEVGHAVAVLRQAWGEAGHAAAFVDNVTILHCTSNYPAAFEDVNLRAMDTIAAATGLRVGYSDHTLGLAVSTAAVARGAAVIEKHFTLDRNLPGPDHRASLDPDELAALVGQIRAVELALGSPQKAPTAAELPVRSLVRRSLTMHVARRGGETIRPEDIVLLRPGDGISPGELEQAIGRTLLRDMEAGEPLTWADLQ